MYIIGGEPLVLPRLNLIHNFIWKNGIIISDWKTNFRTIDSLLRSILSNMPSVAIMTTSPGRIGMDAAQELVDVIIRP